MEVVEDVPPPPTSLKRKGKEVETEGSKKKAKPSIPLRSGGSLNIGGEEAPPQMTPRRSPRSAAPTSRPASEQGARVRRPRPLSRPPSKELGHHHAMWHRRLCHLVRPLGQA